MPRPKENRVKTLSRVDASTPDKVKEVAQALGYTYNKEGSISALLDAIASGEVILIKASPSENSLENSPESSNSVQNL